MSYIGSININPVEILTERQQIVIRSALSDPIAQKEQAVKVILEGLSNKVNIDNNSNGSKPQVQTILDIII